MSISVITVCSNDKDRLVETSRSLEAQEYKKFEWIIVDGGSTDGSLNFIKENAIVSDYVSEEDNGIYDAMNKGIEMAHGEYCLFLNAGDSLYDKEVLSKIVEELDEDLVVGHIETCGHADPKKNYIRKYNNRDIGKKYLYYSRLPHQGTFIRRTLFEKYGKYDTQLQIIGDHDFFVRVLFGGTRIKYIDSCISKYPLDGISQQKRNDSVFLFEEEYVRKKNFTFFYRLFRKILD